MKKSFLPLIVMVTMLACQAPETKPTDAAPSEEPNGGTFGTLDDKTAKVKQLIEAYMKNDTLVAHEIYADTLQAIDGFANNVDSLNNVKVTPGGRAAFIANDGFTHTMFSDISMTLKSGELVTFTGDNGYVVTGYWGLWTGKGKYTNQVTKVPLHMMLWWKGDKVVTIYRIFDPATLTAEVAASQTK